MKKDHIARYRETAVFIGKKSDDMEALFDALRLPEFKLGVCYAETTYQLLRICCQREISVLLLEMNMDSINTFVKARDVKHVAALPSIAVAPYESEAFRRLAEEIGVDRLIVRTDNIKKDAKEFADVLTIKLYYSEFEKYPDFRGHVVSRNSWHDPAAEITDYDKAISDLLVKIGVRKNLAGHKYLVAAISMESARSDAPRPKYLYRIIGEHFGATPTAVEKAIRYAIEAAWLDGDIYTQHRLFGISIDESRGKPTNAEFIARVALEFAYK